MADLASGPAPAPTAPARGRPGLSARFRRLREAASAPPAILALIVLLVLLAAALPASAAEEIESFDARVAVYVTGNVFVEETIAVRSEGERIRHGIFRDVGLSPAQSLEVLTVRRDGAPEPFAVEPGAGSDRIRIGDAGVLLPPGLHRYEISYVVRGAVVGDALDRQVTGTWDFAILEASATVILPPSLRASVWNAGDVTCDTCTGKGIPQAGPLVFRPTHALAPGRSFDLLLRFSPAPPPARTKLDRT